MSTQFNSLVCGALHNTQALALHEHVPHQAAEAIKPYPYSLSLCALWPGRKLFCHMHYKHVCHTLPTICMHLCCFLAAECVCTHHWLLQNVKQLQTACLQTLDAMQQDHMLEPSIQRRVDSICMPTGLQAYFEDTTNTSLLNCFPCSSRLDCFISLPTPLLGTHPNQNREVVHACSDKRAGNTL